jgi:hypothetical protein
MARAAALIKRMKEEKEAMANCIITVQVQHGRGMARRPASAPLLLTPRPTTAHNARDDERRDATNANANAQAQAQAGQSTPELQTFVAFHLPDASSTYVEVSPTTRWWQLRRRRGRSHLRDAHQVKVGSGCLSGFRLCMCVRASVFCVEWIESLVQCEFDGGARPDGVAVDARVGAPAHLARIRGSAG